MPLRRHTTSRNTWVPKPRIIPRDYWSEHLPSGIFHPYEPVRIIVMDEKVLHGNPNEDVEYLKGVQEDVRKHKGWGDLPGHYYIDSKGNIVAGRSVENQPPQIGNAKDIEQSILISFLNDFNLMPPTPEEIESLVFLCAWLCDQYKVSASEIHSMKDYDSQLGPGKLLQGYFDQGLIGEKLNTFLEALFIEQKQDKR